MRGKAEIFLQPLAALASDKTARFERGLGLRSVRRVSVRGCALGKGVFACRRFRRHQVIGRVEGSLLQERQTAGEHIIDAGSGLCLDPHPPFRFLNHSCRPNAELVVSQARAGRLPETFVVALREIRVGEELLIDYAWDADLVERCFCGEDVCRGWIVSQLEADRLRTLRDRRHTRAGQAARHP